MFVDSTSDSLRFSLDLEADHSRLSKCTERSSFRFTLQDFGPVDMSVADHIIHNGSLVPLNLINQQNDENEHNAIPEDLVSIESHNSTDTLKMHITLEALRGTKHKLNCFEGSGKPSKRTVMWKYSRILLHFCKKVNKFGMMVRRVSLRACDDHATFRTRSGCNSPFSRASSINDATFRTNSGCSSPLYDARREIAIGEAILFCKTSSRK